MEETNTLRKAVFTVALVNLLYFTIEFLVALEIKSVCIFADSIDFIEDALINFLIFLSIFWTVEKKAKICMILSILMVIPGLTALWAAFQQIIGQQPPNALGISIIGFGALIINFSCAYFLATFKNNNCSLTKAAFLSARNDAISNILIIIAGIFTFIYSSIWYDIIVGLFITAINIDSAIKVFKSAQQEYIKKSKNINENY